MTLAVTVKASSWPAVVTIRTAVQAGEGHNIAEQEHQVDPDTEQVFHLDHPSHLTISELSPRQTGEIQDPPKDEDPPKTEGVKEDTKSRK